jgi:hypothetical protein
MACATGTTAGDAVAGELVADSAPCCAGRLTSSASCGRTWPQAIAQLPTGGWDRLGPTINPVSTATIAPTGDFFFYRFKYNKKCQNKVFDMK